MVKPVFISYSTADTTTAEQIRDHLEAQGIACWMAPRDIAPGEDYAEQIINAIEGCTVLLLVLSETSNHSQYVIKEVERAIAKRKVVIPLRIHNVTPSRSLEFFISNAQWIDAWQDLLLDHLTGLTRAIRNQLGFAPTLSVLPAPLSSLQPVTPMPRHNLPQQVTPFIGRSTELAALKVSLADEQVRLVTILGAGGIGKTRLALEVAARAQGQFVDGVYFVPLSGLTTSEFLVSAIAHNIGFSFFQQREEPEAQLLDYLTQRLMLLVLDNFEHVLEGATLIGHILQRATRIKLLVTSRERLNLQGEHIYDVRGLNFPVSEQGQPHVVDHSSEYSAVQLFVQSAVRVKPNFAAQDADLSAILRICRMVEGMPLALELAASWVRLISCQEIADAIEHDLGLLTTSLRDVPERHRSMRVIFENSWAQLDAEVRAVLEKLSVFRTGFTPAAAQEVASASLSSLLALVDKSLVRTEEDGRLSLHELLRQFAAEQLNNQPNVADATHERHCAYFTTYLQQCGKRLYGTNQKTIIAHIKASIENIRDAWLWAVQQRSTQVLEAVADDLTNIYETCSWYHEGEQLFTHATNRLRILHGAYEQKVYAKLLARLGFFVQRLGDYERASQLFEDALRLLDPQVDLREIAYCTTFLGEIHRIQGNYDKGLAYLAQGVTMSRKLQDRHLLARALNMFGIVLAVREEYEEARRTMQESLSTATSLEDLMAKTRALNNLGLVAYHQEDYRAARSFYQECYTMSLELGNEFGVAIALNNLGMVAHKQNKPEEAVELQRASLNIMRKIGYRLGIGIALVDLGISLLELDKLQEAEALLLDALSNAQASELQPLLLSGLSAISLLHARAGNPEIAARAVVLVLAHPASDNDARTRATVLRQQLQHQLPMVLLKEIERSISAKDLESIATLVSTHKRLT